MRPARYFSGLLTVAALALLAGCGSQGNPLPPSLELPRPVSDLKAVRKGDRVRLTWTAPRETTDKVRIKEAGKTRVCRSTVAPAAMECTEAAPPPASGLASYTDTLPRELQEQGPAGFAVYTVEVTNARGRSAGLSNALKVPLAPTLAPPSDLKAEVTADGVALSWSAPPPPAPGSYALRVFRHAVGAAAGVTAAELPLPAPPAFLDKNVEWEKSYQYRAAIVTRIAAEGGTQVEVEGEDTPPVEVLVHDVFPPVAPTGVQAVATSSGGQSFIDLTWTPNSEADLAGYNVYRREGDAPPQKINPELVKTPAFRDPQVTAGHTYLYAVSAVDLRANESGRSEETNESVPQP